MAEQNAPSTVTGSPTLADADRASGGGPSRVRKQRSLWGNAWRQFRKHRLAMAGMVVLAVFILATFLGPFLYDREVNSPYEYALSQAPSSDHVMGTDNMGQDLFARILSAGRISLAVGIVAAIISIALGTLVGATAGFFGGFTDSLLMRFTDLFISLPTLPLLLLITFLFRQSMVNFFDDTFNTPNLGVFVLIVGVIGLLAWMPTARLVRASFLSVKEKEYIEAAVSIGAKRKSLIWKHILPNVLSPIIVAATLQVGAAIITESSLSFLGLGFPVNVPTWGQMLFTGQNYLPINAWEPLLPGTMIFLTVLSINYMGDGLRDALDPRKSS